jgi:hypothetical protein
MLANDAGAKKVTLTKLIENPFLANQIFAILGREVIKFSIDKPCFEMMLPSDFVMRLKDIILDF